MEAAATVVTLPVATDILPTAAAWYHYCTDDDVAAVCCGLFLVPYARPLMRVGKDAIGGWQEGAWRSVMMVDSG